MNDNNSVEANEVRKHESRAIARAVVSLHEKRGHAPELVFEGAVRGAAALLMSKGATPEEVCKLFEDVAQEMRSVDLEGLARIIN